MFKNSPYVCQKIWGYENWLISSMASSRSSIATNKDDAKGVPLDAITGADFPLLVKVIQANATLSVQVHPDDAFAKVHENTSGKTECWYVLDAHPGNNLICGLKQDFPKERIEEVLKNGTLDSYLNRVEIKKGDFLYVPSGTVHAITRGSRLLEVQQACDVTYRLFDWGRPRTLHIKEGIDVVQHTKVLTQSPFCGSFSCPYFSLQLQQVNQETLTLDMDGDKWFCIVVLEGEVFLQSSDGTHFEGKAEDAFVISSSETLHLTSKKPAKIMKVWY